jgi:hypothetical protein
LPFPIPDLGVIDDILYDEVTQIIEKGLRRGAVYVYRCRRTNGASIGT